MVTETADIEQAINAAAEAWPEVAGERAELVRRLIQAGAQRLNEQRNDRVQRKRAALAAQAGGFQGVWAANWREEQRNEWPE
jgi:hypothetical protein